MPCIDYGPVVICSTGMSSTGRATRTTEPTRPCTVCGDSWADGYLRERPFVRGWRIKAIAEAIALWEAACECPINRDDDLCIIPCGCNEGA